MGGRVAMSAQRVQLRSSARQQLRSAAAPAGGARTLLILASHLAQHLHLVLARGVHGSAAARDRLRAARALLRHQLLLQLALGLDPAGRVRARRLIGRVAPLQVVDLVGSTARLGDALGGLLLFDQQPSDAILPHHHRGSDRHRGRGERGSAAGGQARVAGRGSWASPRHDGGAHGVVAATGKAGQSGERAARASPLVNVARAPPHAAACLQQLPVLLRLLPLLLGAQRHVAELGLAQDDAAGAQRRSGAISGQPGTRQVLEWPCTVRGGWTGEGALAGAARAHPGVVSGPPCGVTEVSA